jgi:hypothetical protein
LPRVTVALLRLVAAEYAIGARGLHRTVVDGRLDSDRPATQRDPRSLRSRPWFRAASDIAEFADRVIWSSGDGLLISSTTPPTKTDARTHRPACERAPWCGTSSRACARGPIAPAWVTSVLVLQAW